MDRFIDVPPWLLPAYSLVAYAVMAVFLVGSVRALIDALKDLRDLRSSGLSRLGWRRWQAQKIEIWGVCKIEALLIVAFVGLVVGGIFSAWGHHQTTSHVTIGSLLANLVLIGVYIILGAQATVRRHTRRKALAVRDEEQGG